MQSKGKKTRKNAIILAAGIGERAVPLTYETPKGLLKVFGVPMIERQIEQLHEADINDVTIVVGYMKEKFDYLIDKYGVKLFYNSEYAKKNNLASLYRVRDKLSNTFILMSDNYLVENIFLYEESVSWFSCIFYSGKTDEWVVAENTQEGAIKRIQIGGENAYAIQGPAYFTSDFSECFTIQLEKYYQQAESADYYWEHILKNELAVLPPMHIKDTTGVLYEFESFEELRQFDSSYFEETNNYIIQTIASVFRCSQGDIEIIAVIKDGMSNHSFRFKVANKEYVFRLPKPDTGKLVNRKTEKEAYDALASYHYTDEVVFFDDETGIKISEFLDCRIADPYCDDDLRLCMDRLYDIHKLKTKLSSDFDIEKKTYYYIELAKELGGIRFQDFDEMTEKMKNLYEMKRQLNVDESFCHGDYAHVNVLIIPGYIGKIIDLEFCGNGDPIMDISMFAIFAEFDKERIDLSLEYYLGRPANENEKMRLYMYVSLSAFLWTAWSEYKQANGAEFGDYTLKMYRYAKDFYKLCEDDYLNESSFIQS